MIAFLSAALGLSALWYQKVFIDGLGVLSSGNLTVARRAFRVEPGYEAILAAFALMLLAQGLGMLVRLLCSREAAILHVLLGDALYSHTLRLTSEVRGSRTVGEIVNFYAQDVSAAVSLIEEFLGSAFGSIIPLLAGPLFISQVLEIPLKSVLMVSCTSMLVLLLMSWRQSGFFGAFKRLAAERLAIVNEWLQNMRIIRILDWTEAFEARIFKKRIEETGNRLAMVTNGSMMNSIAQVAPLLINVVGILVLIDAKDGQATPGSIFTLIWVFGVFMSKPIRSTPWTLVMLLDGVTSCRRLERFFAMAVEPSPLISESHVISKGERSPANFLSPREQVNASCIGPSILVKGLRLDLGGPQILKDVSFAIDGGSFIAITGDVGTGKTQLLLALLRDSTARLGAYEIAGHDQLNADLAVSRANFLYVPQDGFVLSATLRENIAFYYDAPKDYDQVILEALRLAAFDPMRESLVSGLDSEIGERGVNLSGGQRQRLGLARAYYQGVTSRDRGVVLLDDSLSAVDTETEERLIKNLICGAWRQRTRIFVTHRLSVLKYADQVWNLADGKLEVIRGQS